MLSWATVAAVLMMMSSCEKGEPYLVSRCWPQMMRWLPERRRRSRSRFARGIAPEGTTHPVKDTRTSVSGPGIKEDGPGVPGTRPLQERRPCTRPDPTVSQTQRPWPSHRRRPPGGSDPRVYICPATGHCRRERCWSRGFSSSPPPVPGLTSSCGTWPSSRPPPALCPTSGTDRSREPGTDHRRPQGPAAWPCSCRTEHRDHQAPGAPAGLLRFRSGWPPGPYPRW